MDDESLNGSYRVGVRDVGNSQVIEREPLLKEKIYEYIKQKGEINTGEITDVFGASGHCYHSIRQLLNGKLISKRKKGSYSYLKVI